MPTKPDELKTNHRSHSDGSQASSPHQLDPILGKTLPKMLLETSGGSSLRLPEDLLGRWTLLYFYPKDDTPGCTRQACAYRDSLPQFNDLDVRVYGVSLDNVASHDQFTQKYSLNFPLVADVDHKLSDALGAYGSQQWQGKTFPGLSRDSFLIDPNGRVRKVWRKVSPDTTVEMTKQAVIEITSGPEE